MVVPQWTAQPWYSLLARILVEKPLLLTPRNKILYLPFNQDKCHPFGKKLKLMSCRLSGRPSKIKEFHSQLKHEFILSFWRHGTLQRQFGTYWSKWQEFTCEQSVNLWIPSIHLWKGPGFSPEIVRTRLGWLWKACPILTYNSGGKYDNWETSLGQRFIQGVFKPTPSLLRYQNIWDTNKVLHHLKTFPNL